MNKLKYYFAIGNFTVLLVCSLICTWALASGPKGFSITANIIFPLFYLLLIHTSVTFYETKIRIKSGVSICEVEYDDILEITEMEWRRVLGRFPTKSHVLTIRNKKSIGIEHNMFSRITVLEIIEDIKNMQEEIRKQRNIE